MIVRKTPAENAGDILKIIKTTGCHAYAHEKLLKKSGGHVFIIDEIDNRAANILKQEALSCATDAVVSEQVSRFKSGNSRVVLFGTTLQIEQLVLKLKKQPFGLKELSAGLDEILNQKNIKTVLCGSKKIITGKKTLVMGIINLSPDSFYGDGTEKEAVLISKVSNMIHDGADIIDVGAESTRPGSKPVLEKEEIKKIVKFLRLIRKRTKLPISVDTYKPAVAKAAIDEGADIINDIYALGYSKKMADIVSKNKTGLIIMHMLGTPLTMQKNIKYKDLVFDIFKFLAERAEFAVSKGINRNSIIIDPGIGFGKTVEHNLMIIKKLSEFKSLGLPLAVGFSNKSFLSKIINDQDIKERFFANISANVVAAVNGADIVRVHNVKETAQALKVFEGVRRV